MEGFRLLLEHLAWIEHQFLSGVRDSRKARSLSMWKLYAQLFARNWRCGRFARSLSQGCSEKIRKKDVVMTAGIWSSWSIQTPQFLMLWWPAMKAGSTTMTQRPRDRVPSGRPDRANPLTSLWWSLFWQYWHDLHALGFHWTDRNLFDEPCSLTRKNHLVDLTIPAPNRIMIKENE